MFEIFKGKDQQVYFHIRGNNGEILTHCEGYTRKESAKDTIESIRKWAASADIDEKVRTDATTRQGDIPPRRLGSPGKSI